MFRVIFIIITVLAVAIGLLVGTLNSETVSVDLLWLQIEWPLGLLLLTAGASGLVLGLFLTWLFGVLPLRSQLRKSRGSASNKPAGPLNNNHA